MALTSRWYFVPTLPRSVGFRPVSSPPFSPAPRRCRRSRGTSADVSPPVSFGRSLRGCPGGSSGASPAAVDQAHRSPQDLPIGGWGRAHLEATERCARCREEYTQTLAEGDTVRSKLRTMSTYCRTEEILKVSIELVGRRWKPARPGRVVNSSDTPTSPPPPPAVCGRCMEHYVERHAEFFEHWLGSYDPSEREGPSGRWIQAAVEASTRRPTGR